MIFAFFPLKKKHIFSLTEELYPWFEKKIYIQVKEVKLLSDFIRAIQILTEGFAIFLSEANKNILHIPEVIEMRPRNSLLITTKSRLDRDNRSPVLIANFKSRHS